MNAALLIKKELKKECEKMNFSVFDMSLIARTRDIALKGRTHFVIRMHSGIYIYCTNN